MMMNIPSKCQGPTTPGLGRSRRRAAGFTIVELLVVLAVVAILVAIALVSLIDALDKARQRATMADMRTISKSIEAYMVDHHIAPVHSGAIEEIAALLKPYYSNVIPVRDHWNHDYTYAADGDGNYTIESYGKDGLDGANITVASRFDYVLDIVIFNGAFANSPE